MAFERTRSWQVPVVEAAEAAVHGWAREQGVDMTPKAEGLELARGSQLKMRSSGAARSTRRTCRSRATCPGRAAAST